MIRRIPVVSTLVVLAAVATMIGLGVWQLQRMAWKETLLERYSSALAKDDPVAFPTDPDAYPAAYFRRASVTCATTTKWDAMAGRSADGEAGWVHIAHCFTASGAPAAVQLGWSRDPAPVTYGGGAAVGRIAPYGAAVKLVADPPLAGLAANAAPDPRELPNNHFAYAMQWFFFAATALVIYGLALRRRLARARPQG